MAGVLRKRRYLGTDLQEEHCEKIKDVSKRQGAPKIASKPIEAS